MNSRFKFLGITTFIILVAYAGSWKYLSKKFESHIEEQLAVVQTRGFEVSFDNIKIGGFPFGYDVIVANLEIKRGSDFRTWVDGPIIFSTKIWKPQEISSVAGGVHHLEFDDCIVQGHGFVLKSFTFDPMRFEFFYDALLVTLAGKEILKAKELEYDIDFTPKKETNTASVRMRLEELETEKLKDSPLGSKIEHLIIEASLKGKIAGDTTYERAKNWYDNGGVLEVKELSLKWGASSATGDGTFSLDDRLQPLGSFSASFKGLDEGVDAYVKAGQLDKTKAAILKTGFHLLHNANGSKISVTIQNRKLSLGAVPLLEIPEVTW